MYGALTGRYQVTPGTLTDQAVSEIQLDDKGRVLVQNVGAGGEANQIEAATATKDETADGFLKTLGVLYAFDGTDLVRIAAVGNALSVTLATQLSSIEDSITSVPRIGVYTDRSGTITTGGVSQLLAAANTVRSNLLIQNQSIADLWINFGVAAVVGQPSIRIPTLTTYLSSPNFVSNQVVNIIGATTAQAFTAKEG